MAKKKHLDRLTRDAIAAQKAGMSYGKYKTLHPHTPDEDDEEELVADPGTVIAICERCGGKFIRPRGKTNKRFCSSVCQSRYNEEKKRQQQKMERAGNPASCIICGASFVVDQQHKKYCSPECYAEGQRKRAKELRERYKREKEAAEHGSK